MTRSYPYVLIAALTASFAALTQAEESKQTSADPAVVTTKVAKADESISKLDQALEKEVPVSFQKSEYNDFMTNVAWMNRNGFVVGAPAWKGGEDGLHCH